MKVRVKSPFYDGNGIHKRGEIVEVSSFSSDRMEMIEEKPKAEKPEVKTAKKATIKKG